MLENIFGMRPLGKKKHKKTLEEAESLSSILPLGNPSTGGEHGADVTSAGTSLAIRAPRPTARFHDSKKVSIYLFESGAKNKITKFASYMSKKASSPGLFNLTEEDWWFEFERFRRQKLYNQDPSIPECARTRELKKQESLNQ